MSRHRAAPAPPLAPAAPRFAAAWAALVYAIATLALGFPALAGKFLVTPISDQYIGGYPVREFAQHILRTTGAYPQWNPYIFGGMPYVASMNGDEFYPTFLLRLVLGTDVGMTWGFIIHIFLAGLFTYCFLRAWGFTFWPSLFGGLAYMMGGPISSYVSPGHDGKLFVSALMPLALWMLVRGMRDARRWSWGVLALTVGLAVLSPHPQLLQYMLLTAGAFALYLAFADTGAGKLARNVALARLGAGAAAVVVGFLMGAIQYLPVLQYIPWSPRAGGLKGYEVATSYSFPPEELVNTILPQFSGILDAYSGRNGIHFHSEYLGVVVLMLAFLGFGAIRAGGVRSFARFWLGVLIVTLLWSLGGFTPFYAIVYAIVPGTKFFRAPSTMFYVVAFALAIFAAYGVERIAARQYTQRYLVGWLIAGAAILLLGVSGAFTAVASTFALPGRDEVARANQGSLALGAVRSFLVLAAAVGILFALMRERLQPRHAIIALVALAAVDLWSIERLYWRFSPPASVLYASDPTIEWLKKQDQPGRVLAVPLREPEAYHDPFFLGDALMVHQIRQVTGYHGNELGRYDELLGRQPDGYHEIANPQVWRLLNVRYLLSNVDSVPVPGATRVAGPVKNAAGSTVTLFTLPGDNPFAWVSPVIVKAPDDAVLTTVRDPRFDVQLAALFDTSAKVQGQQIKTLPPPSGVAARTTRYEPGHIALELNRPAPSGAALVVSENYYPGWRARVDGKPATVDRADFVLMGVPLPAGARRVELDFDSAPYETGKTVTLLALAIALVAAAAGLLLDRRARG